MLFARNAVVAPLLALTPSAANAAEPMTCTLIIDVDSGAALVREGICDEGAASFSAFKLALAVMGLEAGIIKDGQNPSWDWRPGGQCARSRPQARRPHHLGAGFGAAVFARAGGADGR
ncbi:MAG: hypothetical protein MO852_09295 [Candidatus Devosia euplotis]|nr:hypothetical protein [Candidatus Devosia euplotis]